MRNSRRLLLQTCRRGASAALALAFFVVSAALFVGSAQAQTFSVVHAFTKKPDGSLPVSGPFFDKNGNLYGSTSGGGTGEGSGGGGTVYKIDAAGHYSVLTSFAAPLSSPTTSLLPDAKGNLYGGTNDFLANYGYLYKVSKSGVLTSKYAFQGGNDGMLPFEDSLIFDAKGNIYGATVGLPFGSPCQGAGCGSLFKFNPKTDKLTPLHDFGKGKDGFWPSQGLTPDAAGNFYGSTSCGGAHGLGTIFELTKAGKYKQLYSFSGGGSCQVGSTGGPWGSGTMALDGNGNLYGATATDGHQSLGMLFKFQIASRKLTVLHTFTGGSDGSAPNAGVLRDAAGNLYGSAQGGGTANAGTVFKLNKSGKFTVLYAFTGGSDGSNPVGLAMDGTGNIYGATNQGGDYTCKCGTVFKLTL
jgi:uncharacterized repeat protein (TIGR03803 family)